MVLQTGEINCMSSFEEIILKFISVDEQDCLRFLLSKKLEYFDRDKKSQFTIIATWVTELYLSKINSLLIKEASHSLEYRCTVKAFHDFLEAYKDNLDEATMMKLLKSYGRVDELAFFANLKQKYEIAIHYYIQQGEAKKALEVLQKTVDPAELQYKFASELIMLDAHETVKSWTITENLNLMKLIPAMMKCSNKLHAKNETHEVIKYLENCVHHVQIEDSAVHDLLILLYAEQDDESSLLQFLKCKFGKQRPDSPDFLYNPRFALRICLKRKRLRACVHLYSMMSMHEEAVSLAVKIDPELAMAEVDKVEYDEILRRRLCYYGK